jgi:hypothetical protein
MIAKAIERGVSVEKLARALNVDIKRIKTKRTVPSRFVLEFDWRSPIG